jgi:hypothetical protein
MALKCLTLSACLYDYASLNVSPFSAARTVMYVSIYGSFKSVYEQRRTGRANKLIYNKICADPNQNIWTGQGPQTSRDYYERSGKEKYKKI